jgi:hypothetical protein
MDPKEIGCKFMNETQLPQDSPVTGLCDRSSKALCYTTCEQFLD